MSSMSQVGHPLYNNGLEEITRPVFIAQHADFRETWLCLVLDGYQTKLWQASLSEFNLNFAGVPCGRARWLALNARLVGFLRHRHRQIQLRPEFSYVQSKSIHVRWV